MSPRPPEVQAYFDDEIIVDSFAGGGGASTGIEMALGRSPDIAINHDAEAIALHKANHPSTEHHTEDVWKVDPIEATRGRPVGLMWLSPDCTHHSKARGGKPRKKRIRGLAWTAVRWAAAVRPRVIILENVEEFQSWGPLLPDGKPDKARAGKTFRAFVAKLRRLGYEIEWRELRACDFGAPTIRKRLFLIARCDGKPIVWPKPSHGKAGAAPWRTAAECIDWTIPAPSIFGRKKPLADNTLRRIARGLQKFVIDSPRPFIVPTAHQGDARAHDIHEPLRTITGQRRGDHAVVVPFLTEHANATQQRNFPADEPLRTQCAQVKGGHFAVVTPYLIGAGGPAYAGEPRRADEPVGTLMPENNRCIVAPTLVHYKSDAPATPADPLPTQTSKDCFGLVAPTLIQVGYGEREGQAPRVPGLDKPLGTVVGGGRKHALVSAFLAKHFSERGEQVQAASLFDPTPTVTGVDHNALVAAHLVNLRGTDESQLVGRSVEEPMPTISGGGIHAAAVTAFLIQYYSEGSGKEPRNLQLPLGAVTSRDRFGVVVVEGVEYQITDIGMRMLVPRELYRAQGFPDSYLIDIPYTDPKTGVTKPMTKTAQVKMVGNSVSPRHAAAIVAANCPELARRERAA